MFYSHQLLARKAPLGQIWMAATLDSKIKRRSLDKLDIPRICEEILNPSIPMALRLSGILMGGVVNVFKRKVDFLYDDVNRFLDDLNRAFKTKVAGDPGGKAQARGRAHARSEAAIAIENKGCAEVDTKQYAMRHSDPLFDVARFQNMTLEDLDHQYIAVYDGDDDPSLHRQHHQADPADITLPDKVDFGAVHTGPFDRFERFDIGDNIFSQTDFTSQVLPDSPPRVPSFSPPPHVPDHEDPMMSMEVEVEKQPPQAVQHEVQMSPKEEPELRRPFKRKARGNTSRVIIDEQTMIPSETFHSWLNDASDISSLRRRRTKPTTHILRSTKIDVLMGLPPLCLMSCSKNFLHQIHYPEPLMELWRKSTLGNPQTPPAHKNRTSRSFPEEAQYQDFASFGDFDIDKMMAAEDHNFAPIGVPGGFTSSGSHAGEASQPIHSSESLTSGRSNKRQISLSIGNLDTVAEDVIMPDLEPLQETGPTQTPCGRAVEPAFDRVTESIRRQLKSHFDTPGNSQAESLNHLADGLTRKRASLLFYHTCVMATMDYVKVQQLVPYGDISISRGPKM